MDGSVRTCPSSTGTEAYRIPASLSGERYRGLPLCMLIAWWIFLRHTPSTVREVSEAFHISARRASDLLLYISSLPHVDSERCWISIPSGGRCRAVTVAGIGPVSTRKSRELVSRKSPVKREGALVRRVRSSESVRNLRSWMISRRVCEHVPVKYLLQASAKEGG